MKRIRALGLVLLCLTLLLASTNCGSPSESPQDGQATDTTPPSAPSNVICSSPCNAATRTFTWESATDDDSGVDYYLATIDGGGVGNLWTILGNVTAYTFEAALALSDGSHTFEVKAVDKAANEGAASSLSFTCDTTQPSISLVGASVASASSVTIAWTTGEPAISQVEYGSSTAYGSFAPATPFLQSSYVVSHSVSLTGLSASTTYHYRVRSIDGCGNEALSGDYTFTTDTSTQLSLQILSVTSPVSAGAYATLAAKTEAGAQCSITVIYKSGPSEAQGLYDKTADSDGSVSWTWKVGTRTTPGSWRIVVVARVGDATATETAYFTVL